MTTIEKRHPNEVTPDVDNVRASMDERELEGLARSFASVGQIQPIIVDDHNVIVAGHRRHAAAQLGIDKEILPADWQLDVIVRANGVPEKRTAQQLVENIQRVDIDPIDEALSYLRLGEMGMNQKDIAAEVGKSATHVSQRLTLLRLPEPQQAHVRAGKLGVAAGVKLSRLFEKDEDLAVQFVTTEHAYRGGEVDEAALDRMLDLAKRNEQFVKEQERAQEFGITAVKLNDLKGFLEPGEGQRVATGEAIVDPSDAQLKKLDADVVGLTITYDGKVAYHIPEIQEFSKDKASAPDEESRRLREIRAYREAFFTEVLSEQVSKDTAADVMLAGLLQAMSNADARKVTKWLGMEIPDEHVDEVMGTDYRAVVIDAAAAAQTRGLSKIAVAIVAARFGVVHPHQAYANTESRRWLEALGYEPHPAE